MARLLLLVVPTAISLARPPGAALPHASSPPLVSRIQHQGIENRVADRYEPVFEQLRTMAPRADRAARVRHVSVRRDVIQFHFEDGEIYLLTPVAGRTVGAVFVGQGAVSFAPPLAVERAQLQHLLGDSVLDIRIAAAALVFTDATLAELERQVSFGTDSLTDMARGAVDDALDRLVDARAQATASTLMSALLNGEANGFFYGYVTRHGGNGDGGVDLMFEVNPARTEQVQLLRRGRLPGQRTQIVCQFARGENLRDSVTGEGERPGPLKIGAYRIEATIANNLGFSATATIRITARPDGVRWTSFSLYDELNVDSVSGVADAFFRAKNSPELWVRLSAPPRPGGSDSIRVAYHGDLIGFGSLVGEYLPPWVDAHRITRQPALDQWFFIKDSETWFPRLPSWHAVDMDLTFHSPKKYAIASIGRQLESRVEGDVLTTRWVAERPTDQVAFNLGRFEEFQITDPRIPPVTVQVNGEAHRDFEGLDAARPGLRDPEKVVGGDVANSLAFFSTVFGPPLFSRYYATEIPYWHGQAFPGLIYLSWWTFFSSSTSGAQETFRAHEMAHQWWGIGVQPASYRDVWLAEGFADFSGLWYMQTILRDNDKFFKELRTRRDKIHDRREDVVPIALGWRVGQIRPEDYDLIIYRKGAWVVQMLRNMMLDFRTMKEDAFTAMMQDFYSQYRGRRASTRDFQGVVERHMGMSMGWFFKEWIDGTAIPTYTLSWYTAPTSDGHHLLKLRVRQEDVPNDFVMPVPLRIAFADGNEAYVRVNVRGAVTEGQLTLPAEPKALELNPLESVLAEVKDEGW